MADGSAGATGVEVEPQSVSGVFAARAAAARAYVQSLATDGIIRGLIGPREAGRLWSRHVLNCAVVAPLLMVGQRVVDVGSGAGLPGIPLALARPDCQFDLVEPLERRAEYLNEMVALLGLSNARVIRGRAEDVLAECGNADVVTSRAVAPLAKLARWSLPLLRAGGEMLALKGSRAAEEIGRDQQALTAMGVGSIDVVIVGEGLVDPPTYLVRAVYRGTRTSATSNRRRAPRGT